MPDWWTHGQHLKDGERVRVEHPCGEGRPLLITRSSNEWNAYCFRCGPLGKYREQESTAAKLERIQREAKAEAVAKATLSLPEPRVHTLSEWPERDAVWFYKCGLSPWMIAELGLYYCPSLGRVVVPIIQEGHVVFWQARSQTRTPKWIAPDVPKRGLVAVFGEGRGDMIVLCEDALSAYKVGKVTEAWSLLGTKLQPSILKRLMASGKRVAMWLDDDKGRANNRNPGQEAAVAIMRQLRAAGITVRNVKSPRDPKYYGADYIREKLS